MSTEKIFLSPRTGLLSALALLFISLYSSTLIHFPCWILNPKKAKITFILFIILRKDSSTMAGSESELNKIFIYKKIKVTIVIAVNTRKNELGEQFVLL